MGSGSSPCSPHSLVNQIFPVFVNDSIDILRIDRLEKIRGILKSKISCFYSDAGGLYQSDHGRGKTAEGGGLRCKM